MAAVLRSSFGKAIRRAFSTEGTFFVRRPQLLRRRLLQTTSGTSDSTQVDPIVEKVNVIATKATYVHCIRRTVQEEGKSTVAPYCLVTAFLFTAAYRVGFCSVVGAEYENTKESNNEPN